MFKFIVLFLATTFLLLNNMSFAIPSQEDFYHNYYKIESKAFSGKVLTRLEKTPLLVKPVLGECVSISSTYGGHDSQQWIIAPISPNNSEFYIINKETGYPLMIDGNTIRCNTSGVTDDRQRFKFKNVNGDYFQIQSASTVGCFYKMQHKIYNGLSQEVGYYYTLFYSNSSNLNDDYSYFKLTSVGSISGSSNVSAANLVYQPNFLFNIPEPSPITNYMESRPKYINETVMGESWVPFTLVNDPAYSPSVKVTQTPFYKIIRTQSWEKAYDYSYEPGAGYTQKYKLHQGITQSQRQTTVNTVEHSWSTEGKAEFKAINQAIQFALGASYSSKLSTSVTLVTEYSEEAYFEIEETLVFNTPDKVRFIVYELVDKYYIKRMDGSNVVDPLEIFHPTYYKFRTFSTQPITYTYNPSLHTTTVVNDYAPQNFTAGANNNHPYLQWNASTLPGLSYYEVWKKKNDVWSLKATTATTNYTDPDELIIAPSAYVYYKVCAVNNSGQKSNFTNEIRFSVTGDLPKNPGSSDSVNVKDTPSALQIQNYPNPFNPSTNIRFSLPDADNVLLQVFDINGQLIETLIDGRLNAGNHDVVFNAKRLCSGMYLYKITTSKNSVAKRMLLLK